MSEPVTYTQHSKAVRELLQLHKEGRLKLDPPFQRRSVWSPKQRKHLMASIFEGFLFPQFSFIGIRIKQLVKPSLRSSTASNASSPC